MALEVAAVIIVLALAVYWGFFSAKRSNERASSSEPVSTKTIAIDGCYPVPRHARLPDAGTRVTFVNGDKTSHTLSFGQAKYVFPPGGRKQVVLSFIRGPSTSSYDCDRKPSVGSISYKQ